MSNYKKAKQSRGVRTVQTPAEEKYQIQSFRDFRWSNLKNVIRYNHYAWMLIALVVVGAILRFVNLGFNSIWLDESLTYGASQMSFAEIWDLTMTTEINPPLFYWIEHIMSVFGSSEIVLRFIPALLGTLTIPVIYFVGREISGRLCGIIAAGLVTFSTFHLYYSQDARAYTTMLFIFSLAVLFYLLALKSNKIPHWCVFGLLGALSVWTHFTSIVGIGVLFLHAIIVKRKDIIKNIRSLIPFGTGILAFMIVFAPLLIATIQIFIRNTASAPTWGYHGIDLISNAFLTISGSEVYLTVIYSILAVVGLIYLLITKDKRSFALLFILELVLISVVSLYMSYKMAMTPRHLMYILPFFFVAIASAFCFIPKHIDYKKVAVVVLILCCLISIPYYTTYYSNYTKEDWKGTASLITDWTNDGDYVVAVPSYMYQPFDYYYDSASDNTIERGVSSVNDIEKINQERGSSDVYYYMTWDISAADTSGAVVNWLSDNTQYLGQNVGIHLFKSSA